MTHTLVRRAQPAAMALVWASAESSKTEQKDSVAPQLWRPAKKKCHGEVADWLLPSARCQALAGRRSHLLTQDTTEAIRMLEDVLSHLIAAEFERVLSNIRLNDRVVVIEARPEDVEGVARVRLHN